MSQAIYLLVSDDYSVCVEAWKSKKYTTIIWTPLGGLNDWRKDWQGEFSWFSEDSNAEAWKMADRIRRAVYDCKAEPGVYIHIRLEMQCKHTLISELRNFGYEVVEI